MAEKEYHITVLVPEGCKECQGFLILANGWTVRWVCLDCGHEMWKAKDDRVYSEALCLFVGGEKEL